jgi:hypothetical protein
MHLYWVVLRENNPYGLSEDIFDRIATSLAVDFIANLKRHQAEYLKRFEDFKDQGNDWEEVAELLGFQPDYLFREFLEDIKARYPGKLDDYICFEGAEPREEDGEEGAKVTEMETNGEVESSKNSSRVKACVGGLGETGCIMMVDELGRRGTLMSHVKLALVDAPVRYYVL